MTMSMQKDIDRKQLRQQMRQLRRSLSDSEQRHRAEQLCNHLQKQLFFKRAKHIALYLANDGEIDTHPLVKLCWKLNKTVYLPVLDPIGHNSLKFVTYKDSTPMHKNRYKILQPKLQQQSLRAAWSLDLVFLPLVAFDPFGGRLGMGGGYYDRTFAFKIKPDGLTGPKLIGLAHSFQQVEKLPIAAWDVPLAAVATEKHLWQLTTR